MNDDDILFIDDEITVINDTPTARLSPWKVLIIDDDEEMHAVTKLVLSNFEWEETPLHFLSAYSAYEAELLFKEHNDIAVALVDVVMETDDAGLRLIKTIRDTLNNKETRLILRTGQPGQAPERKIIREYDISDYKNKTELSGIKLDTLMCNALRAYQSVMSLKKNKVGLEIVAASSLAFFESDTHHSLAKIAMNYLTRLIKSCTVNTTYTLSYFAVDYNSNTFDFLDTAGNYSHLANMNGIDKLSNLTFELISQCIEEKHHIYTDNAFVMNVSNSIGDSIIMYFEGFLPLTEQDISLLNLFATNTMNYFDKNELRRDLTQEQQETNHLLNKAIDYKSKVITPHIFRLAEITYILALELGYSIKEAEHIKSASSLLDLRQIDISDNMPDSHSKQTIEEKSKLVRQSVGARHNLIYNTNQDVLRYAALINYQRHEKWNGSGFPNSLKGEEIDLVSRIVSLVDTFDALSHDHSYKEAWQTPEIMVFIEQQASLHFDPKVVTAFKKKLQQIIEINEQYKDTH